MSNGEVKRWSSDGVISQFCMSDHKAGPWIEAIDHERIVAELKAEVERLQDIVDELVQRLEHT